jgi:DNA-binding response OmpR family regulator
MPRILIVDDDHFMLSLVAHLLQGNGYRVLQADHGQAAIELACRERPDLILLDLLMPGEDGYSVCRRLKAIPAQRTVPVIFLSGMRTESDIEASFSAGGTDCVVKPFEPQVLLKCVETHLPSRSRSPAAEPRPVERSFEPLRRTA